MTVHPETAPVARSNRIATAGGLVLAAAVASALNAAVAGIAHAAGASHAFRPLQPSSFIGLTVIGTLVGAVGWGLIRARAADPRRLLRVLVPVVLAVSLVPDLLVGISATMPGTGWGAVTALISMHLVVGAVAVPVYLRVLPLPASAR